MSEDELKASLPPGFVLCSDGSFSYRSRTTLRNRDTGKVAELEQHSGNGAVGTLPIQAPISGRFLVRVTSFRHRLIDEDNLCEKYHVDLCRYAGIIPCDGPRKAKIEVAQEKVGKDEPEFVRIQIFQL